MDNLTAESAAVRLYGAMHDIPAEIALNELKYCGHLTPDILNVVCEHERIYSERIAAIAIERDRLQQDSIEQAKAINRLAAAAEDRNIVDKNKEEFFLECIAAAVKAARVQALEQALAILDEHSALRAFDLIEVLITAESQGGRHE